MGLYPSVELMVVALHHTVSIVAPTNRNRVRILDFNIANKVLIPFAKLYLLKSVCQEILDLDYLDFMANILIFNLSSFHAV